MKRLGKGKFNSLGLDQTLEKTIVEHIDSAKSRFRGLGKYSNDPGQLRVRRQDTTYCIEFAVFKHLGFEFHTLGEIDEILMSGTGICVDYFYGDYLRDEKWGQWMTKTAGNDDLPWLEVYRNGLFFALICDDDTHLKLLINWVEPCLPFDETSYLLTPQDNAYHKLLASFLRGTSDDNSKLIESIVSSRKRRPKLLFNCLDSIQTLDARATERCLKDVMEHFLKTDFDTRFSTLFSVEASIIWHVAKKKALELSGLSEKQTALIMTRESLGFEDK